MFDCIIIGAGPGGIVCTKEFLERGITNIKCIEQSDSIGGVFSSSYDSMKLTSSAVFSMFSDHWVGEGQEHYFWSKKEAVQYWVDYAHKFNVMESIQFGTKVIAVDRLEEGSWTVKIDNGETLHCKRLVVATGNNNEPKFPMWAKKLSNISFSHSRDYRNADGLEGKRVLVVGGGESASDVALEASMIAEKCWVSLRASTGWVTPRKRGDRAADISTHRAIWSLPRSYGATLSKMILKFDRAAGDPVLDALVDLNERVPQKNGIWGTYGTKTLALPKAMANHGCRIVGEITKIDDANRALTDANGDVLENVDIVIFSTGYKTNIPFLPEEIQQVHPRNLYKHIFEPSLGDSIAWIGLARPAFGSQFPIMEMQARYCAHVFSGDITLPDAATRKAVSAADSKLFHAQFGPSAESIPSLVDYFKYMDGMAKIIGCAPPILKYFFLKPRLWMRLVYGPTQATQFRLAGRGAKTRIAQEILYKVPVSKFNHVVKAGLKGRVKYAALALVPKVFRKF